MLLLRYVHEYLITWMVKKKKKNHIFLTWHRRNNISWLLYRFGIPAEAISSGQMYVPEHDTTAGNALTAIEFDGYWRGTCSVNVFVHHIFHWDCFSLTIQFKLMTFNYDWMDSWIINYLSFAWILGVAVVLINYDRISNVMHVDVSEYNVFHVSSSPLPGLDSDPICGTFELGVVYYHVRYTPKRVQSS